ncbi:MAG: AraC family transcriptional regulator [Flavobacterium sp.]|nr:MAG: AraC family transcriptional regulator [Flavobacterium sp.]
MQLYIKNMVCNRCKMVVKAELEKLGFNPISIELGDIKIKEESISDDEKQALQATLNKFGFELLTEKKEQLVEQVKTAIIELVHYTKETLKVNLSDYLNEKLGVEYANLSATFSEYEHQTIEKYFIAQKIEKVKELLTYGEKSLSEIAYELNYSSVAHLSNQFKKVTGETPTAYKLTRNTNRKTLNEV